MPSGRTHDRITLWSLPVVGGLTLASTRNSTLTLLVCSGFLFGGLMFGPDLDIQSVQFKRWGWFRWIWVPYRGSISHRSPLSHSPITGTALRIVYLLMWLSCISFVSLALLNEIWQMGWTWGDIVGFMGRSLQRYQAEWLVLCLGLELGALSHYIADGALTLYRKYKRQGWKALKPPPISAQRRKPAARRKTRSKASSANPHKRKSRSG